MYKRFSRILAVFQSYKATISLLGICILGLAFGTFLAGHADVTFLSLMRTAATGRMSIVGLLVTAAMPFLLAFLSVYLGYSKLLLLICFFQSFRLSFISMICYGAFGPGGWLIRLLFQFSDLLLFPLFCWFLLRNISRRGKILQSDMLTCLLSVLFIAGIDYCIVSPFLAMLIEI